MLLTILLKNVCLFVILVYWVRLLVICEMS